MPLHKPGCPFYHPLNDDERAEYDHHQESQAEDLMERARDERMEQESGRDE